jgi:hypothetical protein
MMNNLKLILLKTNECIVAQIEEIVADYGMPNCKLINPFQVGTDYIYEDDERWEADKPLDDYIGKPCQKRVVLERWPWYTDQTEIMFQSDSILTIVSANAEVVKAYIDKVPSILDEEPDEVLQER